MHQNYLSPFSWRYGSDEMRALWSEIHKRRLWRRIWVELARAQSEIGLVSPDQAADLARHADDVDIARAEAIEAEIHHDLMAEVRAFAEQCPIGGGVIHLGATSADIEDNADALRIREALGLISHGLREVLETLVTLIRAHAHTTVIAFTHLQPAEPTTMGYRFALYAQDILDDWRRITQLRTEIRGKGLKGAVGTRASYDDLLTGTGISAAELEARVLRALNLSAYPITGQTYPRKQDLDVLNALGSASASLYKFAFDLRILQSPVIGEWAEPFSAHQVGSSAMPFKRNPIHSEKIDSLARLVHALGSVAWDNAAHSLLERTLDDSANRREILPTAFLAVDEIIRVTKRILKGLRIDQSAASRNLAAYGPFAATERVLMAAVRAGGDRQILHEHLRELSLRAWSAVAQGEANPLVELVIKSDTLRSLLSPMTLRDLMSPTGYIGDAPERALNFADTIEEALVTSHS